MPIGSSADVRGALGTLRLRRFPVGARHRETPHAARARELPSVAGCEPISKVVRCRPLEVLVTSESGSKLSTAMTPVSSKDALNLGRARDQPETDRGTPGQLVKSQDQCQAGRLDELQAAQIEHDVTRPGLKERVHGLIELRRRREVELATGSDAYPVAFREHVAAVRRRTLATDDHEYSPGAKAAVPRPWLAGATVRHPGVTGRVVARVCARRR